MTSQLRIFTL